jgi:hypothetical protein
LSFPVENLKAIEEELNMLVEKFGVSYEIKLNAPVQQIKIYPKPDLNRLREVLDKVKYNIQLVTS